MNSLGLLEDRIGHSDTMSIIHMSINPIKLLSQPGATLALIFTVQRKPDVPFAESLGIHNPELKSLEIKSGHGIEANIKQN